VYRDRQGLQEVEAHGISTKSAHEAGRVVSPTQFRLNPPRPQERGLYSLLLEADSTPVRPEGLSQRKISMIPPVIESAKNYVTNNLLHKQPFS